MSNYIIGTAGHVDHGKSRLVQRLTGIDPDRLPEEKERGLTLDLGFAHLNLPSGIKCGIVDVPGHEKYVKNMLAGVGGVDFALLVVDAGEGIKEQTREHLSILQIMGIRDGITVITKIDRVSADQLALVEDSLKDFLKGTFLEKSPVIGVSAETGEGIQALVDTIDKRIVRLNPRPSNMPFRLPVDRVFTRPGFGAVVTGTIYQGEISLGKSFIILPQKFRGKARHIQVHGVDVEHAVAGQRVAINVAGVNSDEIARGDQLLAYGSARPAESVDVFLRVLADCPHPLKNRSEIRFYLATSDIHGVVYLLDSDELQPGESGYAQIALDTPVVALPGDPFVFRAPSAIFTWGGGGIIDPYPVKHRRFDPDAIEMLKLKQTGSPVDIILKMMGQEPYQLHSVESLSGMVSLPPDVLVMTVRKMEEEGSLVKLPNGSFISREVMELLEKGFLDILSDLEQRNPNRIGATQEELKHNLSRMESALMLEMMVYLKMKEKIKERKNLISSFDFAPRMDEARQKIYEKFLSEFKSSGFSPPDGEELKKIAGDSRLSTDVLEHMIFKGELVRLEDKIYFLEEDLAKARRIIGNHIVKNGSITPAEARELLGTTRKYMIPVLEYFDRIYFTRRKENKRVLFRTNIYKEDQKGGQNEIGKK